MPLARLADRLIFQPTCDAIAAEDKSRSLIRFGDEHLELWSHRREGVDVESAELFVLKFPGTGGRAERATEHPADVWSDVRVHLSAFNPPGYGGSSGRPSLKTMGDAAAAALDEVQRMADGRPVVLTGNSLGGVSALHLAATRNIAGLVLRNPPPLRDVIVSRFGWWTFWLGAGLIARQVPKHLCAVSNAGCSRVPAVFVSSGRDRVVPPRYQRQIIEAYAGEKRVVRLADADHACPLSEEEEAEYARHLHWLKGRVLGRAIREEDGREAASAP